MKIAGLILLAALLGGIEEGPEPSSVSSIICFSDSGRGMALAEKAAEFLTSRGQANRFSKSYVVSALDEQEDNRLLILILSEEGETAFRESRAAFEPVLLSLLREMKAHFEGNNVSVILQGPDKANLLEASLDGEGIASLKSFTPRPAPGD
ncbi:MAG: hypothetical protein PHN82_11125 [bacterium]|nr:hypothetical protein [bacterium]